MLAMLKDQAIADATPVRSRCAAGSLLAIVGGSSGARDRSCMTLLHREDAVAAVKRSAPGANSFALMFALESITRALLATVIPLQAYAILGEARDVSVLLLAVALTGLVGSFTIPLLIRRIGRRWVYPLGGACLLLCAVTLATQTLWGQVVAMLARVFGTACLNITLNLYIMDYIHKRDLVRSEPRN